MKNFARLAAAGICLLFATVANATISQVVLNQSAGASFGDVLDGGAVLSYSTSTTASGFDPSTIGTLLGTGVQFTTGALLGANSVVDGNSIFTSSEAVLDAWTTTNYYPGGYVTYWGCVSSGGCSYVNGQLASGREGWITYYQPPYTTTSSGQGGPWYASQTGYEGLKLSISGQNHYGWIQFVTDATGRDLGVTAFAYETVAGVAAVTGSTMSLASVQSVPEPGEWVTMLAGFGFFGAARSLRIDGKFLRFRIPASDGLSLSRRQFPV